MSNGHVLLISPDFFSYQEIISKEITNQGYLVTWWDDRAYKSSAYKFFLRLFPFLFKRISEKHFFKKIQELNGIEITHILVIKGEGISERFIAELRRKIPKASAGFYLWDSVNNVKGALSISKYFDAISTFDLVDADKFSWNYRPLFSSNISLNKAEFIEKKFDWCFIGSIHSDRYNVIHQLLNKYSGKYKAFVFCFFQSSEILIFRKIFDKSLRNSPKEMLSLSPMSKELVQNYVDSSIAVLDIEHPNQNGLTMRTIETILSGKKLITTNANVYKSNLYDPSRVIVIDRRNPVISESFLKSVFIDVDEETIKYYSISGWVSELLLLQGSGDIEIR